MNEETQKFVVKKEFEQALDLFNKNLSNLKDTINESIKTMAHCKEKLEAILNSHING